MSKAYIPEINGNDASKKHVPMLTPRPKHIKDIQVDAEARFVGFIMINNAEMAKDIVDYFSEYDYWEEYDESKWYSKRSYFAAYKGVMQEYNNFLCAIKENEVDKYYVVAKRVVTELNKLEPYCTCIRCASNMFNPLKYIWCPVCTKCIKAGKGYADPTFVESAKNLKNNFTKRKYFVASKFIKVSELLTLILVCSFIYLKF
jgi:hypothetical protein